MNMWEWIVKYALYSETWMCSLNTPPPPPLTSIPSISNNHLCVKFVKNDYELVCICFDKEGGRGLVDINRYGRF